MATETRKALWEDVAAQELTAKKLEVIVREVEGWWILLVGPSCLIKVASHFASEIRSLWGRTHEGYGEAIAEALAPEGDSNINFCRGLVFRILRMHPGLRKEVLKTLLKEEIDGIPLEDQRLYRTLVD